MNEAISTAPDAKRQIASIGLAILLLRPNLTIESANPAAEQLLGRASRKLAGKTLFDVITFETDRVREWLHQREGHVAVHSVKVKIGETGERVIDITLSPVSGTTGWQVVTLLESQASARREAEELPLRAPAILAHEIKNPLAAIRGAAQLLSRKVETDAEPLTQMIANEVDRIAKLVDRMQSLGREQPEPVAPCNLHEVIRRAREIFSAADDSGITIHEEFDPSIPPVLANEEALVQVLINLMSNARDAATAQGEPRIVLRTRYVSGLVMSAIRLGRSIKLPVEIRVSDNGPGIDSKFRDHIFEPFVSSKKNGQGLGLALVSKLVRDMNGRIGHERDDSDGLTHFRVNLPIAK